MSLVHVTTEGLVNSCGLYCYLKSCECLWPMLLPRSMLMSITCAAAEDHAEVSGPWSMMMPEVVWTSGTGSCSSLVQLVRGRAVRRGQAVRKGRA